MENMSDEEKKAVEILNKWLCKTHSEFCKVGAVGIPNEEFFATEIVLNLIEKQSKEIEELKEDSCCMTNCVRRDKEKLFLEDKIKAKIEDLKENSNGDDFNLTNVIMLFKSLLEKE